MLSIITALPTLVLAAALPAATPSPACATAEAAVRRAQTEWRSFLNADFVEHAAEGERQRRFAIADLARADHAARFCRGASSAKARAALHYEIAVVDARRENRVPPPLPAPLPVPSEACAQPDRPPVPLGAIVPASPGVERLRRPHGTTVVAVLVGADGGVLGTFIAASSGDGTLDTAASSAARLVGYAPALSRCRPVQGEFRFSYTFPQLF